MHANLPTKKLYYWALVELIILSFELSLIFYSYDLGIKLKICVGIVRCFIKKDISAIKNIVRFMQLTEILF